MNKRSKKLTAGEQILMDHVRELRTRIAVCAVILVIGGVVGYLFYEPILAWLRSPLGQDLYYSSPAGSFNFIIKVASMVGILAAVPFFVYQLIMFVQPAFKQRLSRGRVFFYALSSILLAAAGAAFAFYVILPGALKFFAGFQVQGLSALIDANSYLNFVTNAIVTFIIVFQIPLLMVIIDRIKPIPPKKLLQAEKWVVIGGLSVSLFVPFALDITTCLLIASPIIILYNLSVVMIVMRHALARKKKVAPVVVEKEAPAEILTWEDQLVADFFDADLEEAEVVMPSVFAIEPAAVVLTPPTASKQVVAPEPTIIESTLAVIAQQKPVRGREPRDAKPTQAVDIEAMRAAARLKKEQEIAKRVAEYNAPAFKIINDIR